MIHHLEGILEEKAPGRLIVDVGGVGFEVHVPDATWREAGIPGTHIRLLTHLVVREDQWSVYGFRREEERALFRLLLDVQGVGPKLALAALSHLGPERLRGAIREGDLGTLGTVSGIGKKTAQRMVVDLRDKLGAADAVALGTPGVTADGEGDAAVDALVTLGYSRHIAREAVRGARAVGDDLPVEEVVRDALRRL